MRDLAVSFAQLAAIIMILLTLAVWTAAFSQWTSADNPGANARGVSTQSQAILVSDAR
ncbi:MAG TPA: hypothetical protein VGB17_05735 [Pyrinomonadaceae bacterium]